MFKHILVPTDGSEFSDSTVKRAISFAKEAGAEITAFYAQPDYLSTGYYGEAGAALIQIRADSARFSQEYAEKILSAIEASCREAGVKCNTMTQSCLLVYEGIIEAATKSGCDLIFMASHGRSGVAALLLGSETQKVLTHSKIPVLVYR
jgi:nucleotide-binding universal stress UspA family protein